MANHPLSTAIERLRLSMARYDEASLPDAQLLGRFIEQRDEAAFAALTRRHGPMVMGVCLRVARNRQDAEDAFQATFLVLVRKAASIASRELLANWLYGVAYNTALKAKAAARKRRSREKQVMDMPEPAVAATKLWSDLLPLLDHELSRLPDKYRIPIILCDLEGKTHKEAARKLGCPEGSLSSRLSRARRMLAKRLGRHGLAVSGGTLAALLSQTAAPACVPAGVVFKTVKGATLLAAGQAATGVIPARVAVLAEGVLKAMLLAKLKIAAVMVLLTTLACIGVGVVGHVVLAVGQTQQPAATEAIQKTAKPVGDAKGQGRPPKKKEEPESDPLPPDALLRLGTLRHRFLGHNTAYQRMADGQTIILASVTEDEVRWVDSRTGRRIDSWSLPKGHTVCGFSDDGRFALITNKKTISLWDLVARKEIRVFQAKGNFGDEILASFSPDGKVVATNHGVNWNPGLMRLWDVATGKQLWQEGRMGFHNVGVSPLGFLLDGETLVVRDWSNNRISVRDRTSGKERRSFETLPYGESRQTVLSPDGKNLFMGTLGTVVRIWNVATGEELPALGGHKKEARHVAISPNGKIVLTGGDEPLVHVWEWPAGKLLRKIELPRGKNIGKMAVSFDEKRAEIIIWGELSLRFFDLETGKELPGLIGAHRGPVNGVAITRDGRIISSGVDNTIREWDFKTGRQIREFTTPHPLGSMTQTVSADGRLVATAEINGGTVVLFERDTGRVIRNIETGKSGVEQVAFAPEGRLLAVAVGHRGVQPFLGFYDTDTGKEVRRLDGIWLRKLVFHPDGKLLACLGEEKIRLVDVTTARIHREVPAKDVRDMAFSPDGRTLAWVDSKGIGLWESATAEGRGRIEGPSDMPDALRFSPNGRWIAHGDHEGAVHLYDVLHTRKAYSYGRHDASVTALDFSPDGRALVSSSFDTTLMVWDVAGVTARLAKPTAAPQIADLAAVWNDLGSADPVKAYDAVRLLAQAPDRSLPLLREGLKPARDPDAKQIESLLAKLDSPKFAERDEAKRELERRGSDAEPALERFLAGNLALEARRRAEAILARAQTPLTDLVLLKQLRALEVLEIIGNAEAQKILLSLAAGPQDARVTREARGSVERLKKRLSRQ